MHFFVDDLRPLAGIGDVKAEEMHTFFVQQPGVIDTYTNYHACKLLEMAFLLLPLLTAVDWNVCQSETITVAS
jgi:hypothetical protein